MMPGTVLLATDLGSTSSRAEATAVELAADRSWSLVVLSVIDPGGLRLPGGGWSSRVDQVRSQRERSALRIIHRARAHGVTARFMIWEGAPGESIVEAAQAERADVIVVGTHSRGLVGRLLLGSVSTYVVKHADREVVVVPPSGGGASVSEGLTAPS